MIVETEGVVLSYIKYKESSIIVKIYTQKYGLKSFLVNGIRSKKAKRSIGLFQPFTLLEIVIYYHEDRELLRLSDAKIAIATPDISQNIIKSSMALFITEVLSKTMSHEHHENPELYAFAKQAVFALQEIQHNVEDFHLLFLIRYSDYLGLSLMEADMIENVQLSITEKAYLNILIAHSFGSLQLEKHKLANGEMRKHCLEAILSHFNHHLGGMPEIKSLKVLHQIFH